MGASLLATLKHFSGPAWTPELAADWKAAYELIGSVMSAAASADEQVRPSWWRGTVVAHEPRSFDISVLLVQPEPRMDYVPGQSVAIESPAGRGCGATTPWRTHRVRTGCWSFTSG